MAADAKIVPLERIDGLIHVVRGQKVMLDRDLAVLYGVETRVLNQAVRRNVERFPEDFMLRLERPEILSISQSVTSSAGLKFSKNVLAFTEQGVAMLSGILSSQRAVRVNIEIMRAFVRMRLMVASNAALERKLAALEQKCDRKFKVVFDAIRELMDETLPPMRTSRREIGFHTLKAPPIHQPNKKRGKPRPRPLPVPKSQL